MKNLMKDFLIPSFLIRVLLLPRFLATVNRCEDLVMPLCRGLWYNRTRMPNMFNHETQEEAGLQVNQFMHLVTIKCSPDLHFFLCSIYTPICVDNYDKPLPPCRSICQRSKDGCTPLLRKYGFHWPPQMTCDQFPEMSTDKQLCMERNISSTTLSPVIVEPTLSNYGVNNEVVKSIANFTPVDNKSLKLWCRCNCRPPMIKINSIHHVYYNKVHTGGILNCAWPCLSPFIDNERYNFISLWLCISVGLIYSCCLSSLLTFILNRRILMQPPHRFVVYICFCQIGMSIGFVIRLVAGHYKTVCFQHDAKPIQESLLLMLRFQNSAPSVCSISFLFIYFFFLASVLWWWLLCLTWLFSDGLGWSNMMIDKYSQLYHFISWFFPGILSMLALTMSAVDGDSVTGLCSVGNINRQNLITFLLIPVCVFTFSGFFILACGFLNVTKGNLSSSNRLKLCKAISSRSMHISTSVDSSIPKIRTTSIKCFYGFLGLICSIPLCLTISSILYEMRWHSQWELITTCSCLNKFSSNTYVPTPSILLYIMKYSGFFSISIICGPWIWPMETYNSWLGPFFRLILCRNNKLKKELHLKSKNVHNCHSQKKFNTTYTISTSCQLHDHLVEGSMTQDSLLLSSLNPTIKCHHRFPTTRIGEMSLSPDSESYASYQSLSNYIPNQIPSSQEFCQYHKSKSNLSRQCSIFQR